MIKVKICGITSLDDALVAVDAGADALGFVFYASSSRTIAPEVAADIVANLPPFVSKVGVFVDSDLETVRQIESFCHLDMVQLHGDESPGFCAALFPKVIKAFGMRGRSTLDALASYRVPAYLLDAYSPEMVGGTGKAFDWELAREATGLGRVILAGGLTPLNVRQAIESVGPYGVDVSTGVESSPGKKDAALVHAFVRAVKGTTWQKENEQDIPQAGGPGARRRAQDQQHLGPGPAGIENGKAADNRRDRREAARRGHGDLSKLEAFVASVRARV